MSKLVENEDAFTGLEAAIVLIAFIVVAAVFSYVMLGAGFFATGEAQRVVDTGVAQATSNLEVAGPVIVKASSDGGGKVANVTFLLQLAAGGASVDMEKVTFTVATTSNLTTFNFTEVNSTWYAKGVEQPDKDNMLDKFETVKIDIPGDADAAKALPLIEVNDRFTVEVKPDIGAVLPINRMAPPDLLKKSNYEVY